MPNRERTVLFIYSLLAAVGIAWSGFTGRGLPIFAPSNVEIPPTPSPLLVSLSAGLLLAGLSLAFTAVARRHWARFQRLHTAFAEMLGPLSQREVIVLTLSSSIAEELFFRVAMQPTIGLWPTALIFGAVHFIPHPDFRIWTPWAFVMGALFGGIFEISGVAAGPILAHALINYFGLRGIAQYSNRDR